MKISDSDQSQSFENFKHQLCLKEIDVIQGNIARFDQNGLTIKSWCLALWTALTAIGIESKNISVSLIPIVVIAAFAFIEIIYRRFQSRFIGRSREIEEILTTRNFEIYEYSVYRAATRSNLVRELRFIFRSPQLTIFYTTLALMTILVVSGMLINPQMFSGFDASDI